MIVDRPDLGSVEPEVLAYIESLEAELLALRSPGPIQRPSAGESEPAEPPTTSVVISATRGGLVKRTFRHLYDRQRRAGMGIFDIDAPDADPPALLAVADAADTVVMVTSDARAFPMAISRLVESPVRSRGEAASAWIPFRPGETLAMVIPARNEGYLVLATERGQVRRFRYNLFGRNLAPGTMLYEVREGGAPAASCWSDGAADLFMVASNGNAIRFNERLVPVRGCLGMRVDPGFKIVGVAPVNDESGVFLLGDDGRGTVRLMAGFGANKAPGAGGKAAVKAERVIGAVRVAPGDDLLVLTQLSKIIRFRVDEVPAKEGVVQGVQCISLRADTPVALTACTVDTAGSSAV